jgi:hypothetical protein
VETRPIHAPFNQRSVRSRIEGAESSNFWGGRAPSTTFGLSASQSNATCRRRLGEHAATDRTGARPRPHSRCQISIFRSELGDASHLPFGLHAMGLFPGGFILQFV